MAGFENITVIGVGLIGGSLGLALKKRRLARQVVGVGHREPTLRTALEAGAIDRWTLDVAEGAADADLVVICTPVGLVARKAAEALAAMKPGGVLTDVASTKAKITRQVEAILPNGVAFVPAHPMAGSEKRGIDSARADLFEGSRCILTPTGKTPQGATDTVRSMWEAVGASVEMLEPEQHDRIIAQISHLPHLIAPLIINSADDSSLPYAASGLRDTTRIAASDVGLWLDIFKDNHANLASAVERFREELAAAARALEEKDWQALAAILERARARRVALDRESQSKAGPK